MCNCSPSRSEAGGCGLMVAMDFQCSQLQVIFFIQVSPYLSTFLPSFPWQLERGPNPVTPGVELTRQTDSAGGPSERHGAHPLEDRSSVKCALTDPLFVFYSSLRCDHFIGFLIRLRRTMSISKSTSSI
ncbi:hypothetical protein B296_00002732 [Ensete ventricosum]|uniref:Uncharacterized protein n=1 Tax=Ensete ventricosum TaxID=4639 RepID=A0A427AXK0_ENSVE|nr:hypothetical protein B296_00002732 [Ensete ventricosum]